MVGVRIHLSINADQAGSHPTESGGSPLNLARSIDKSCYGDGSSFILTLNDEKLWP